MIVYGVGESGKDINVNNDFMIHIPYGYCYEVHSAVKEGDKIISITHPENEPSRYRDGRFFVSDDEDNDISVDLSLGGSAGMKEGNTEIDFPIEEKLSELSREAKNKTFSIGVSVGDYSDTINAGGDENNFHRTYRVIQDLPFIKAGYYTVGIAGITIYCVIIASPRNMYIGTVRFSDDNYIRNESVKRRTERGVFGELISVILPIRLCRCGRDDSIRAA